MADTSPFFIRGTYDRHVFCHNNSSSAYACVSCRLISAHTVANLTSVYHEEYCTGASGGFEYIDYDADTLPMVPTCKTYLAPVMLLVLLEHLYYFTRAHMKVLFKSEGFDALSFSSVGNQFTFQCIFKTLYMWQNFFLWRWLSRTCSGGWLSRLEIPVHLYDNMFVVAKKI